MIVEIQGADQNATNNNGTHWKSAVQVSAKSCHLYKLSLSALTQTDVYIWFFDLAAGSSLSAAPVMVRYCPGGSADTWDFVGGSLFTNGLYIALSSALPVTPASTVTDSGDDAAIIRAEYRI